MIAGSSKSQAPHVASPLSSATKPRICFVGLMTGRRAGYVTSQGLIVSELLKQAGYPVTSVSSISNRVFRFLDIVSTLLLRLKDVDVVVLEIYGGLSFVMEDAASWLAKLFRRRLIMVLHGGALPEFTARYPRWSRRVLGRADVFLTPSPYLSRTATKFGWKVRVVPNVVDLPRYPYKERRAVQPRLFWMRSFHELYNPWMALRVLQRVKEIYPEATLIMAGQEKGLGPELRQWAAQHGLEKAVSFPGFLDMQGKIHHAAAADIFLNTNHIDNTPVAVIEAAAMGLPVIATRVGGVADLLTDGQDGLLVPDNDDKAMAEAVVRLVQSPALAHQLSVQGHALARRCSWEEVYPLWTQVLAYEKPKENC